MSSTQGGLRILLIDDHELICKGLAGFLSAAGHRIAGTAAGQDQALSIIASGEVDLAVVDIRLRQGSGLDTVRNVSDRFPHVMCMVYSVNEDGPTVNSAISAGAMGYVTKSDDPDMLLKCIDEITQGRRFLSPRAASAMADLVATGAALSSIGDLSPRELQVYEMIGRGLSSRDIAESMELSVRTIDTYIERILIKLNIPGRRELRINASEHAVKSWGR